MCEYCENEKKKNPNDKYGVLCPKKAGRFMGNVINKVILGEQLTDDEEELFRVFSKPGESSFMGIPLKEIYEKGGIITNSF